MKKCILIIAIIIAISTNVFAQKVLRKSQLKSLSYPFIETKREENNANVMRNAPNEEAPVYSTNNVVSQLIGESSVNLSFTCHSERQISTVNTVGTNGGSLAFIFRQNWQTCGSAAVETGILRYNLSTDGGQTWFGYNSTCLGQGPLNPNFTIPARFPNALLFSDGGTSINNLNLAYSAPTISGSTWTGCVYGTANDLGNVSGPVVNQEDYVSSTGSGIYIPENIAERVAGEFWSAVLNGIGDLEIRKGAFIAASNTISWNIEQTINISNGTALNSPIISFSADGQKGYLVMAGNLTGGWEDCLNPIICEYNIGTGLFGSPYELSFNDFAGIPLNISQWTDTSGVPISDRGSMTNHSITVDSRGELHIFALVVPASGVAAIYNTFGTDIYDMTKDLSGNWAAIHVDTISNAFGSIGAGTTAFTYLTFTNISRSADGKQLIYSWNDTDTTGMGANVIANPNLKGRIYDVLQDKISPIINWTSGDAVWDGSVNIPKAAEIVLESTNCTFRVPTVVIRESPPSSPTYHYFSNIEYTCSQATDTTQWMKNCNISPITITPTLTSPSCGGTTSDGAIQINATGGTLPYNYYLTNILTGIIDTFNYPIINNLSAGIYDIYITDASGCQNGFSSIILNQTNAPTINAIANNSICGGNTSYITLNNTSSNCTYSWNTGSTNDSLYNIGDGNYWASITCGGCTAFIVANIDEPPIMNAWISPVSTICSNVVDLNPIITNGTPPYSYQWSDSLNTITSNLNNASSGSYTLTVTDANGCQIISDSVFVIVPTLLNVQLTLNSSSISATTIGGTGVGTYTFSWFGPACFTPVVNSTPSILIDCAACNGIYTVIVIDQNACTASSSVTCTSSIEKDIQNEMIGLTSFSLVPNPAFEVATISLAFERSENVSISIVNVHGQSVFEKKMGNVLNVTEEIKVKDWAKGVYYVKISTDNGIISRKLVIN
jgi:hypothetical protein